MTFTVTINRLRESGACVSRFAHLLNALGPAQIAYVASNRELVSALNSLTDEQRDAFVDACFAIQWRGSIYNLDLPLISFSTPAGALIRKHLEA